MKLLSILFIALTIQSCATATKDELDKAYYGSAPDKNKIEEIFKNAISYNLKDPSSIQIQKVSGPEQFWTKNFHGFSSFWLICGEYNAKNSYGGYVGIKSAAVWYKDNRTGVLETLSSGEIMSTFAKNKNPCPI